MLYFWKQEDTYLYFEISYTCRIRFLFELGFFDSGKLFYDGFCCKQWCSTKIKLLNFINLFSAILADLYWSICCVAMILIALDFFLYEGNFVLTYVYGDFFIWNSVRKIFSIRFLHYKRREYRSLKILYLKALHLLGNRSEKSSLGSAVLVPVFFVSATIKVDTIFWKSLFWLKLLETVPIPENIFWLSKIRKLGSREGKRCFSIRVSSPELWNAPCLTELTNLIFSMSISFRNLSFRNTERSGNRRWKGR